MRKKFERITIPKCPWHNDPEMTYLKFFSDAGRRAAKGEEQMKCAVCGYWFWPDQFGVDPVTLEKTSDGLQP